MRDYSSLMSERDRQTDQFEGVMRQKEAEVARAREEMKEKVRASEKEMKRVKEEMAAREEQMREEIESRINEYEDTLNMKIRENSQ